MRRAILIVQLATSFAAIVQAQNDSRHLSEATARSLSLFGTLAPAAAGLLWWRLDQPHCVPGPGGSCWTYHSPNRAGPGVLIATAVVLGPSLGHFYAGRSGGAWVRLGVGVGAPLLSAMVLAAGMQDDGGWFPSFDPGAVAFAGVILAAGAATIVATAAHDIATASQAARERNERQSAARVRILPDYAPSTHAVGLRVRVTF